MVDLPCTHGVEMSCADENDIAEGKKLWPKCRQPAHSPYLYTVCKHELKLLCYMFQEYNRNPSIVSLLHVLVHMCVMRSMLC